jgi:hypothetical protein
LAETKSLTLPPVPSDTGFSGKMTFGHDVKDQFPMDQKSIVLYLHMNGMALNAIREDLVRVLGENAIAYSTVTK